MKSLFQPETLDEVQRRLAELRPESERQWGKMSAAQMLAHCSAAMEWATGERECVPAPLPLRVIGRAIKPLVFRDDAPMKRNSPTVKELLVAEDRDFGAEQGRLRELIARFAAGGPAGCTTQPHSFFGRLTPEQWGVLMYKHLDHHLRQFGV
jgi:hypothetical protein